MATTREIAQRIISGNEDGILPITRIRLADAIDEALRERERDITDRVHAAITYYCGGPKLRAMTPRETADWIIKRSGLLAIRRNEEEGDQSGK